MWQIHKGVQLKICHKISDFCLTDIYRTDRHAEQQRVLTPLLTEKADGPVFQKEGINILRGVQIPCFSVLIDIFTFPGDQFYPESI